MNSIWKNEKISRRAEQQQELAIKTGKDEFLRYMRKVGLQN